MIPWAKVRLTKYFIDNLSIKSSEDIESFTSSEKEKVSSIGDEVGEVFDFDLAF